VTSIITSAFVASIFLLNACSSFSFIAQQSNNDWSYELPNNYVIWRVNSRKIICGKKETENSVSNIGGNYVTKFRYNEQYVCLQCADVSGGLSEDIDESNPQYYIVDTMNDKVVGPLLEEKFEEELDELKDIILSPWISTIPKPDEAKIP
jgi:hypothetical protein